MRSRIQHQLLVVRIRVRQVCARQLLIAVEDLRNVNVAFHGLAGLGVTVLLKLVDGATFRHQPIVRLTHSMLALCRTKTSSIRSHDTVTRRSTNRASHAHHSTLALPVVLNDGIVIMNPLQELRRLYLSLFGLTAL